MPRTSGHGVCGLCAKPRGEESLSDRCLRYACLCEAAMECFAAGSDTYDSLGRAAKTFRDAYELTATATPVWDSNGRE